MFIHIYGDIVMFWNMYVFYRLTPDVYIMNAVYQFLGM